MRAATTKVIGALAIGAALASASGPALALMAPNYERLAEFKAIIENDAVLAAFPSGAMITAVEYVDVDSYKVTAGQCFVAVKIVGKPMADGMVGARQFDVVPGAAACN